MDNLVGKMLGPYEVEEQFGSGGMAQVFKARQRSMSRTVAIKIMSPLLNDDPQFEARFRQEAQTVAALEHPHILPVIDFGEQEGVLYLVMRYVGGGTLHDLIRKGPMPPQVALRYLTDIGSALDYAHSLGVVHRDIKPKNVLLDAQGNAFVADFGLAKITAGGGITRSGLGVIGTPHYMSPEQGRGMPVDGRSDLYALGVVLYEMLTGKLPFDADSTVGIVMKHISEPVPPASMVNANLPPALDAVIAKALAKDPPDRYQSGQEFAQAVAQALGTTVLTGPVLRGSPRDGFQWNTALDAARTRVNLGPQIRAALAEMNKRLPQDKRQRTLVLGGAGVVGLMVILALFAAIAGPRGAATAPTQTRALTATTVPATQTPTPPPTPTEPAEKVVVAARDQMTLVYIPAGKFLLGSSNSDPNARDDEKPQLKVYLDPYWIDRTEVSVGQFTDFVNATGYVTDAEKGCCESSYAKVGSTVYVPEEVFVSKANWKLPEGPGGPEASALRPVVQVSWNDAKAYCEWAGRRLPTEAEWDKAARGTDGLIYPWGNEFRGDAVNFCDKSCGANWRNTGWEDQFSRTSPVGTYATGASPFDVLDMAGNVWEWAADFYDSDGYYRFPTANPPGLESGPTHVVRGGSWIDTLDRVRASARLNLTPDARNNITGFRCATTEYKP